MESYYCKRYQRTAPGATAGTLSDQMKFEAKGAVEAENVVRKDFQSGVVPMNWEIEFATLEDANGNVIVTWLNGIQRS